MNKYFLYIKFIFMFNFIFIYRLQTRFEELEIKEKHLKDSIEIFKKNNFEYFNLKNQCNKDILDQFFFNVLLEYFKYKKNYIECIKDNNNKNNCIENFLSDFIKKQTKEFKNIQKNLQSDNASIYALNQFIDNLNDTVMCFKNQYW
jgi:hypothetical protein